MAKRWYLSGFVLNPETHEAGLVFISRPTVNGFHIRVLVLTADDKDLSSLDSYREVGSGKLNVGEDPASFVGSCLPSWQYIKFPDYIHNLGRNMTFTKISALLGRTKMTLSLWHTGSTLPDVVRSLTLFPYFITWLRRYFIDFDSCTPAEDQACTTPRPEEILHVSNPSPEAVMTTLEPGSVQ